MTILRRLQNLENPIRIVVVGAGAMGRGLVYQAQRTPGLRCVGVCDIEIHRATRAASEAGLRFRIATNAAEIKAAIENGETAVCEDGELLARVELADVFIETTSSIIPGARFCLAALDTQKHLVLMNAEIDLAFGPFLRQRAQEQGVVYTSCDGDQHGVLARLIDSMRLWGFELVLAGNVKGFLDRYVNPTTIVPEADKRNLDYRMCTAFTDGTKLNIEMALLANGLGLRTDVPGMHGPRAAHVHESGSLFDLQALRRGGPVVDYVLGAQPDGGVFAIGYCDHPYQQSMLRYYKMGEGPFYLFYRPYHLCHVEAMECVAAATLDSESLLEPLHGLRTNVVAYAKRDLRAGEELDGIGGYTCYGLIENKADDPANPGLPVCLADGVPLLRDVACDERIPLAAVRTDPKRLDFDLFARALAASAKEYR